MLNQYDQFILADSHIKYTVLEIFKLNNFSYLLAAETNENDEVDFDKTIVIKNENNSIVQVIDPEELETVNSYITENIIKPKNN